jgi:hypothetical protein
MKAAVLAIEPDARLIDVTHNVEPQKILHGAVVLADTSLHFAVGTIHVAVVDPGVGTERHIIAAKLDSQIYVAPDNGLLTLIARRSTTSEIVRLNRPEFWRPVVSRTFHGRDVMAPVAAHIARGVSLNELGDACERIVTLDDVDPVIEPGLIRGRCLMVDSFGNLITNVTRQMLPRDLSSIEVLVDEKHCVELVETYGRSEVGSIVALFGSSDRLEIAEVQGSAARRLGVAENCAVVVGQRKEG